MSVEQTAPGLERIVSLDQEAEELGTGYGGEMGPAWLGPAEGPVWWRDGGYLLFSDIHADRRMKWAPRGGRLHVPGEHEPRQRTHPGPPGQARGL